MKEKTKLLKVSLPISLWEKFYLLYPGRGQRIQFLKLVIEIVVQKNFSLAFLNKQNISNLLEEMKEETSCSE